MPRFSFIIPVKPGRAIKALAALEQLDDLSFPHEILVAEGKQPSRQRNIAAREASGEILYFLDDDSIITSTGLSACAACLSDQSVAVAGGPSITPNSDTRLQKLFGTALSSLFGAGAIRNRYRAVGLPRETTDKELILCNMAIRREVFTSIGGLDERLYPNEENELLDRIKAAGHRIMHVPEMAIYRSQRKTLNAFVLQMFTYGRGRAEQTRIAGIGSVISFIPMFFVIYLLALLLFYQAPLVRFPLYLYVIIDILATFLVLFCTRDFFNLLLLLLFPLMHCCNGIGLLYGFCKKSPEVKETSGGRVVRIKGFSV